MQQGYSLLLSESWYSGCKDVYFECINRETIFSLNRESQLVLSRTPIPKIFPSLFFKRIDSIQPIDKEMIQRLVARSQPFFLFVHHMQPHSPWYFDRECNFTETTGRTDKDLFRESVYCVNRRVTAFAKRVIEVDPDAIIVIHSDHGTGFIAHEQFSGTAEYQWPIAAVDERSETISLVRAPRVCSQWLRSDFGPVNTARFLVGCLARTEPVYLPERLFLPGPDYDETQAFIEYGGFRQ